MQCDVCDKCDVDGAQTNIGNALAATSWSASVGPRLAGQIEALEQAARDRLRLIARRRCSRGDQSSGDELLTLGDEVDLLMVGSRGRGPD